MVVHIEQQTARLAGWCRGTAVFSAVLFLISGAAHRFGLLETVGFVNVLALVGGLAVMALAFAAFAARRVWMRGDRGAGDIVKGVLVAVLVLVPFGASAYRAIVNPPLNDVSTDTVDPPSFDRAAGERGAGMNPIRPIDPEAAKRQADAFPEVTGRRYDAPQSRVLAAVVALVGRQGWQLLVDPRANLDSPEVTVEAVARSFLLGFASDVAIRVTDEGTTTYVDMRSASRFGHRDLGDNAERIVTFLDLLDADIAAQAGTLPTE